MSDKSSKDFLRHLALSTRLKRKRGIGVGFLIFHHLACGNHTTRAAMILFKLTNASVSADFLKR